MPIPSRPGSAISLDFVTGYPKTKRGNDTIMTVVDMFSKRVFFIPTNKEADTALVAKLFFERVVRELGLPDVIVSDRGSVFTSELWKRLWAIFDTRLNLSSAFHPQTDGQTERTNRTIEEMQRAYADTRQDSWDEDLPALEFAVNDSINMSTGRTPFFISHGFHPRKPLNFNLGNPALEPVDEQQRVDEWQAAIESARRCLERAKESQKFYADAKRCERVFKVGDKVLLSLQNINVRRYESNRKHEQGRVGGLERQIDFQVDQAAKLLPRFDGPFAIEEIISPVAYKLTLSSRFKKLHPVFHVSKLIPYLDPHEKFPQRASAPIRPEALNVDEHGRGEYVVERIMNKEVIRTGKSKGTWYFVKWSGYPVHEGTWQHIDELSSCMEAVHEYENSK
jgi:hypothetical protein